MSLVLLTHKCGRNAPKHVYVETSLKVENIRSLIGGLNDFLVSKTEYAENAIFTPEMIAEMMCIYFDSKIVKKKDILNYVNYEPEFKEIEFNSIINIPYTLRELEDDLSAKYCEFCDKHKDDEFLTALCNFYNDYDCDILVNEMKMKDIINEYK